MEFKNKEFDFQGITVDRFKILFRGCSVILKDKTSIPASKIRLKHFKYNQIIAVKNPLMGFQYIPKEANK